MPSTLELTDQWVLVTGASAGIGEAFARAFSAQGAKIIAVARREERLKTLASRLATQVEVIALDLETPAGVDALIGEIERRELPVHHLVNNAGFGGGGSFLHQDPEQMVRMLDLNCTALLRLTRHFLPRMVSSGSGGVIQIASLAGFVPTPYMATYGATKAFVLSLTTALAEELRGSGVRMLAVCPGPVPTEFQERAGYRSIGSDSGGAVSPEQVVRESLRAYTRGRHVVVPGKRSAFAAFISRFGSPVQQARAAAIAMKRAGRDSTDD